MSQPDPGGCGFDLLFEAPLIAMVRTGPELPYAVRHMAALAQGAPAHLLCVATWHLPRLLPGFLAVCAQARAEHPNIAIAIIVATSADQDTAAAAGLDAVWCCHNALVNERTFFPEPEEKRYDAVYSARLMPFKRHELAYEVPRMAVMSGTYGVEREEAAAIVAGYRDLAFSNSSGRFTRVLSRAQVRHVLNRACCGLALSAREGAMFASIEYLLCGLPVVTTPSEGGRDTFFHPDYVTWVEPDPGAVAAAVAAYVEARPDPALIRARTLALIRPHRARLLDRLSALTRRDLAAGADENLWMPVVASHPGKWIAAS